MRYSFNEHLEALLSELAVNTRHLFLMKLIVVVDELMIHRFPSVSNKRRKKVVAMEKKESDECALYFTD